MDVIDQPGYNTKAQPTREPFQTGEDAADEKRYYDTTAVLS